LHFHNFSASVLGCNALLAAKFGLSLNFVKSNVLQLFAMVLFAPQQQHFIDWICYHGHSAYSLEVRKKYLSSSFNHFPSLALRWKAAAFTYMFARLAFVGTSLFQRQVMCNYFILFFTFFADFIFGELYGQVVYLMYYCLIL